MKNELNFSVETKQLTKGRRVIIRLNGVEVGRRTSGHPYRFALIVTGNQEHAIRYNREQAAFLIELAEKYEATQARTGDHYRKAVMTFGMSSVEKSILANEYAQWAISSRQKAAKLRAEADRLEQTPNLPEYNAPLVASWHRRRDLVADVQPWQKFVAVVEIPE
jgi:hypothetical protein